MSIPLSVIKITRHDNGLTYAPYHTVLFHHKNKKLLAVVFDAPGYISVLPFDGGHLQEDDISIPAIDFTGFLRAEILNFEDARCGSLKGSGVWG